MKRFFDFFASLILLIVLSPLFLIVSLIIIIDDGVPVIFSQPRVGMGNELFNIYKFRTMVVDSEKNGPELAAKRDSRLTKFGKFLREHHLDELPQLWNVLIGDMSLVGYRPERQYYIDQIKQNNPAYDLLYCSRPGITSKATIYNGYTDTMEKMLRRLDMDLEYLRTRTLTMDMKIIFRTVFSVGKGDKI